MTDAELIARLRENHAYEWQDPIWETRIVAADRIEALTKERDEAEALQSCGCSYDTPTDVCLGHHRLFERLYAVQRGKLEAKLATCEKYRDAYAEMDRIGTQAVRDLEAKLAKAVAFLDKIATTGCWFTSDMNDLLKELKGENHE